MALESEITTSANEQYVEMILHFILFFSFSFFYLEMQLRVLDNRGALIECNAVQQCPQVVEQW